MWWRTGRRDMRRGRFRIRRRTGWCGRSTRILAYHTPLKVLPVVEEFLREMAPYEPPEEAAEYRNIRKAVRR